MNGPWHALQKISVRWEGTPPSSKSFHPKYLFRMRLCRFPVPLEHPRVPHAAFNNPEQLIVRLARRMEGKHRRARIERVFRFALGGIVRITLAARAIAFEKPHSRHQVFFCGRDRVHKMRCVPRCRPIERQMREDLFSVRGVAFAFVGNHPSQAAANAPPQASASPPRIPEEIYAWHLLGPRTLGASSLSNERVLEPWRSASLLLYFVASLLPVSNFLTKYGIITCRKITGSGHTFTCRPRCPPCGLIHASLGTSPLLRSK